MQTFKFSIPGQYKFLFSTDCYARRMTFSLIWSKFLQSTVPCVHSKSPWLLGETEKLSPRAVGRTRIGGHTKLFHFCPSQMTFPLFCLPNSSSAFETLLKFPLLCDSVSASSNSLPCTSQFSGHTLMLSPTTCFVTFLFKASARISGRKIRWYNLFGEHFGNVYENDKPRACEQYTNPSVRTFSCSFIHQVSNKTVITQFEQKNGNNLNAR